MLIKHDISVLSPRLTAEPQTFGTVTSIEDLRQQLIDMAIEQHEVEVSIDQTDLEVFFSLLEADGSVESADG